MLPSLTQRAILAAVLRHEWIEEDTTMEDLKARFEQAAQEAQQLPRRPDNTTMLQLYALYKQSTAGDVSGARPGVLDMQGRMKYDSWGKVKGITNDEAMRQYIDLVERLKTAG
jgi:acyl-CoA-binding protein